jgi:hypothetical protein
MILIHTFEINVIFFLFDLWLCIVQVGMIVGILSAIILVGLLAAVFVTYHKGSLVW